MKPLLKRYEASVTALKANLFIQARLKLTGLSVITIALIVLVFSIFLFNSFITNLLDTSEETFSSKQAQHRFLDKASEDFVWTLFFADLAVLICSSFLSFLAAGRMLQPLKQNLEMHQRFAEDASHELRTPLTIMQTASEVALRSKTSAKADIQAVLQSNLEEIEKMTQIVNDLLTIARSTTDASDHQQNEVDITDLLKQIMKKITPLAKTQGIAVRFNNREHCLIYGETILLERMMMNILQNALQHTPSGGLISVSLKKAGNTADLAISDTGEGIEESELPLVFDRFYKGAPSTISKYVGTGLGLAIVKGIVEKHHGVISLQSVKGKGTDVLITFPLFA